MWPGTYHADYQAAEHTRRNLFALTGGGLEGAPHQEVGRLTRISGTPHATPALPKFVVVLILAATLLLGGGWSLAHAQQGTPAPAAVTTEVLGQGLPSAAPGQALWLLRVTFAPGAAVAAHTHPGATIYHLNSGTLVFILQAGSATLHRSTGTEATPAPEEITIGEEIVLNAGDWISYEGDAVQIERNDGAEPAVVLISNLRGADEPARHAAEGTPTS